MKLEIKHLAPYLPYELKVRWEHYSLSEPTFIMDCDNLKDLGISDRYQIKPILRPLSDLTKEIDINGENIMPCEYWEKEVRGVAYYEELTNMADNNYCDEYLPYFIQQTLIEWHFDVFGLIEKGLAIDINKINKPDN